MNRNFGTVLAFTAALAGCTHARISPIPMLIEGVGTVYRYEGRANFPHQLAEADRMIAQDCKARNGGTPVVVNLRKRDLGTVSLDSGQANARVSAIGGGNATVATSSNGSTTTMRNYNQEILYKCAA